MKNLLKAFTLENTVLILAGVAIVNQLYRTYTGRELHGDVEVFLSKLKESAKNEN